MTESEQKYDMPTAAAYVLGHARHTGIPALPPSTAKKTAAECTAEELEQIVLAG